VFSYTLGSGLVNNKIAPKTHLWRDVWETTTPFSEHSCPTRLLQFVHRTKTEVRYLEGPCGIKENIFGLEIPMTHALRMNVSLSSVCGVEVSNHLAEYEETGDENVTKPERSWRKNK
jgi:hypothetical protein